MKSHEWLQYLQINVLAGGDEYPSLDELIGICSALSPISESRNDRSEEKSMR